jgi:hypothetical protein
LDNVLDIRAEVRAIELARENKMAIDAVIVRPVGSFKRGYGTDIVKEHEPGSAEGVPDYLTIDVSRDGIFHDEGFDKNPFLVRQSEVDEDHRMEERGQKSLMFDAEFNLLRTLIELAEECDVASGKQDLLGALITLDSTNRDLDGYRSFLVSMIPLVQNVAGDIGKTEALMSRLMGDDIKVSIQQGASLRSTSAIPPLGESVLGFDLLLGETMLCSYPSITIHITCSLERLERYLDKDSGVSRIIALACQFLLPFECEHSISLHPPETSLVLSDEVWSGRLGFTTNLMPLLS